jgi:hypothetical protein
METDEKRRQVADQYRVVAHLASALMDVHKQIEPSIRDGISDDLLDLRGKRSAHLMEVLGDILNGMDAVDNSEDGWTAPIFKRAQELWPNS